MHYVNRQGNLVIVTRADAVLRVTVQVTVPTSARALSAQLKSAFNRATKEGQ